ncbi:MAG: tetratricopeptide repeat protein [Bryobacteraceae bacterium]
MERFVLWLALALWQQPDPSAEGIKALDARDYAAAEAAFLKASESDPKDYSAWFHLALARSFLGKRAETIAGYRKALELKPGLYEAQMNLGIVLLGEKKPVEAIPLLQSAAQSKPAEFRPNYYLGEALLASGDGARAEKHFEAALIADAKSAPATLGLARAMARQNRLAEAAPKFRAAVAQDPSYKDALLELAALHEKNAQPAEAIAIYEQFRDNPAVCERLGALLIEAGRPGEAVAPLEFAVERSPSAANRVALATAYLRNRQPEKALPLMEKALASSPDSLDLRMMYGRMLRDQKQYRAAAQQFAAVAQKRPEAREAWSELAAMLNLLEMYPQALEAFDKLEALGESGAALYYFRAIIQDRLKQHERALSNYATFLQRSEGKYPDEEFKARQRIRILKKEASKR